MKRLIIEIVASTLITLVLVWGSVKFLVPILGYDLVDKIAISWLGLWVILLYNAIKKYNIAQRSKEE